MSIKDKFLQRRQSPSTLAINSLYLVYCSFGIIGGAILGFLSLGLPGLFIGIGGGFLMGFVVRNLVSWVKTDLNCNSCKQ